MEEQVGQWWHRAITRAAERRHLQAAVSLASMRRPIGMLFHAAGGSPAVRLAEAQAERHGGPRGWLQRCLNTDDALFYQPIWLTNALTQPSAFPPCGA